MVIIRKLSDECKKKTIRFVILKHGAFESLLFEEDR